MTNRHYVDAGSQELHHEVISRRAPGPTRKLINPVASQRNVIDEVRTSPRTTNRTDEVTSS